ncbi:cyclic pyranopterin monophosphate synthase MoaC [Neisseria wadsworthii]|uniref:Cyclic pyranopterin monophosphate synthase n=1 Tax=Neisseria wadsworthii 9715 TaxID=1030841 RepID=G4CST0_9NEIS|nr:cyclic pyranopterin monophosphate synthase MoaC [Neisseria wadsworthii]EGZ44636.1 molybdenum cofactor biosynthesis protein C [Neisseria wadsworthii 9715]QMT35769.1 cyclic pyranopterin monophosphate synthase MoaC [Neisseria wadsworthii]
MFDELAHFNENDEAHMVNIGDKEPTERVAVASGYINMSPKAVRILAEGSAKKGDVLGVARVAAIQGAKQTSFLIPLCHQISLTHVRVDFEIDLDVSRVKATVTASTTAGTGVEMEALTSVNVALLTIYDMLKAVDKTMSMTHIRLESKTGGKSGDFSFEQSYEGITF